MIVDVIESIINKAIVVWKDGSYKVVDKNSSWEFENDQNWLLTINLSEIIKT